VLLGEAGQPGGVGGGEAGDVLGQRGRAGVAGQGEQPLDVGALGERCQQGVLAPAAADDRDPHPQSSLEVVVLTSVCSRPGPTPTAVTGTPPSFSTASTYTLAALGRSSSRVTPLMSSRQPSNSS